MTCTLEVVYVVRLLPFFSSNLTESHVSYPAAPPSLLLPPYNNISPLPGVSIGDSSLWSIFQLFFGAIFPSCSSCLDSFRGPIAGLVLY